jgi:putative intracellular protease/amidase
VEWFGAKAVSLAPDGKPVTGISSFMLTPDRGTEPEANVDLDAIAVIGSGDWAAKDPPDVSALLKSVSGRGGVVGGICAGTLAIARSGLLKGHKHTSNGRAWILERAPGYAGSEFYENVPHAVASDRVVTAPGSAPGTFAKTFLKVLYPDQKEQLTEMGALFAREYAGHS